MDRTPRESEPQLFSADRTPKQVFRDLRNYLAGQAVGATRDDTLEVIAYSSLSCL